jgi:hypothetical protein
MGDAVIANASAFEVPLSFFKQTGLDSEDNIPTKSSIAVGP